MARKYGLPYQGSKSKIADWVLSVLPRATYLVDLFAGGCAITHAALLSDKWQKVICNDITDAPSVFYDAARGEYTNCSTVLTRQDFFESDDTAMRLLYSFGNDKTTYLYADEIGAVKLAATRMLCAPSTHERRLHYRDFCRALVEYLRGQVDNGETLFDAVNVSKLQNVEALERLQSLERLERLERLDYRLVDIPEGATVYCDPPYRSTPNSARYGKFDFAAFDAWLNGVDFPVYVSEYDAPTGCAEVASIAVKSTMSVANNDVCRVEKIFVQERFADEARAKTDCYAQGTLFDCP